jgi:hypothetical protein
MSPFKSSILLASALVAAASYADFTPNAGYSVPTTFDRTTQTIAVAQFNPSLGVLKAIRLRYYHRANGTFNYEIMNPNPSPIGEWTGIQNFTTRIAVTLPDGGIGQTYTQAFSFSKAFEGLKYDGNVDYDGDSGGAALISSTGGGVGDPPACVYRITNPAVLSVLTGIGNASVSLKSSISLSPILWLYGSNPFPTYTQVNMGGSSASIGIIYEYTPTPP